MGKCLGRNKKKPKDFDDLGKIGSVHTIRNLSDLSLCLEVSETKKSFTKDDIVFFFNSSKLNL